MLWPLEPLIYEMEQRAETQVPPHPRVAHRVNEAGEPGRHPWSASCGACAQDRSPPGRTRWYRHLTIADHTRADQLIMVR